MSEHVFYKYSITIYSNDLALVHCLRALSQFSQQNGNNRIPWGGTKEADWKKSANKVTFHFSRPEYREIFQNEIKRLLPVSLWKEVSTNDNDPAIPQSK